MITYDNIDGKTQEEVAKELSKPNLLLPGDQIVTLYNGSLYQGIVVAQHGDRWTTDDVIQLKSHGLFCDRHNGRNIVASDDDIHVDYYRRAYFDAAKLLDVKAFCSVDTYDADPRVLKVVRGFDTVHHSMVPHDRYIHRRLVTNAVVTHIGPCVCKKCNSMNVHAEPNQKDGTYVCYECR